jgi:hypothetical protein
LETHRSPGPTSPLGPKGACPRALAQPRVWTEETLGRPRLTALPPPAPYRTPARGPTALRCGCPGGGTGRMGAFPLHREEGEAGSPRCPERWTAAAGTHPTDSSPAPGGRGGRWSCALATRTPAVQVPGRSSQAKSGRAAEWGCRFVIL